MCCLLAVAALFGPRFLGFVWWLLDPVRWGTTFPTPLFGLIGWLLVPWTTIAYVFAFPNGVEGLDWGLIALALRGRPRHDRRRGLRARPPPLALRLTRSIGERSARRSGERLSRPARRARGRRPGSGSASTG